MEWRKRNIREIMEQLTFDDTNVGVLPNGNPIKVGDIVKYELGNGYGFTRIVLIDGKLCLEDNYMYGQVSLNHFLSNASYNTVKVVKLVDIYKDCKAKNISFKFYVDMFSNKSK